MLDDAAFEAALSERLRVRREEAASNPETSEYLARYETFWAFAKQTDPATGKYLRGFGQSIWEDGVAAFEEGLGESSCPFRSGAWRRYWLEAYRSPEREPIVQEKESRNEVL